METELFAVGTTFANWPSWVKIRRAIETKPFMNATLPSYMATAEMKISPVPKKRVLLVDDDLLSRKNLFQLLTKEGYSLLPAATGIKALEYAAAAKFDLALLDFLILQKA